MKQIAFRILLTLAIIVVGGLALWQSNGRDIYSSAVRLLAHLDTTGWPSPDTLHPIERTIRKQYGSADWYPHLIGPTSPQTPLTAATIDGTFRMLGHGIPRSDGFLDFKSNDLPAIYGSLLNELLLETTSSGELTRQTTGTEDFWKRALNNGGKSLSRPSRAEYSEAKAQATRLSEGHPLRKHYLEYLLLSEDVGVFAPSFDVGADPPYSDSSRWKAETLFDATLSRCRGTVSAVSADHDSVPAEVFVYARVVVLDLKRPWMRTKYLDDGLSSSSKTLRDRYFGEAGFLRLVPEKVWVQVEDQVLVNVQHESQAWMQQKIASNDCCVVVCKNDRVLIQYPSSFEWVGAESEVPKLEGSSYVGIRLGQQPSVYAVISRRRVSGPR